MPEGKFKSRTYKRVHVRVPSGESRLRFERRKPKSHKCAKCGKVLKGIPRELSYKMKKLSVSKKRVERPFGGNLCSECSRRNIINNARIDNK